MTQSAEILYHLQNNGPLTPIQALNKFGCFRLGARIYDLRQDGHDIKTETINSNGKHFAKYRIAGQKG